MNLAITTAALLLYMLAAIALTGWLMSLLP